MIAVLNAHIWEFIAGGAVAIGVYFFQKYNTQIEKRMDSFIKRVSGMLKSNETKQSALADIIITHNDNMGKATKAINGDMLSIKGSVFGLKKELQEELMQIKNESAQIARDFEKISTRFELATEAFDQRYGQMITLAKRVENNEGKLMLIEKQQGRVTIEVAENTTGVRATKETLDRLIDRLKQIKIERDGAE